MATYFFSSHWRPLLRSTVLPHEDPEMPAPCGHSVEQKMVNAGKCWARHPGGATETGVKHQGERPQGKISEPSDILAESFRRDEVRPVERQAGIPAGTSMGTGAKGPQALSKKRNRNGGGLVGRGAGLCGPLGTTSRRHTCSSKLNK